MVKLNEGTASTYRTMLQMEPLPRTLPPSNHNSRQINPLYWKCRHILLEWLTDLSHQLKLSHVTLHGAVSHLDLFLLKKRVASTQVWPILACACLLISAKMEEPNCWIKGLVDALCVVLEDEHVGESLCKAEKCIVMALEWKLCVRTSAHFLAFYDSRAQCFGDDNGSQGRSCEGEGKEGSKWASVKVRDIARELVDLAEREYEIVEQFEPQIIASAAVALARSIGESRKLFDICKHEEVIHTATLSEACKRAQREEGVNMQKIKEQVFVGNNFEGDRIVKEEVTERCSRNWETPGGTADDNARFTSVCEENLVLKDSLRRIRGVFGEDVTACAELMDRAHRSTSGGWHHGVLSPRSIKDSGSWD